MAVFGRQLRALLYIQIPGLEPLDHDDDDLPAMARARTTLVVDLALTAALMLLTALVLVTLCRDECY